MLKSLKKNISEFIMPVCGIILILALLVASTLAWFSLRTADETRLALGMGKVSYSINTPNKLFKNFFDIDGNYEDTFDPDEGYHPVDTSYPITFMVNGIPLTDAGGGNYSCQLPQNTMGKITLECTPVGATDKILYSSQNSDAVSVSAYGTLAAIGDFSSPLLSSSIITVTLRDRTPVNPRADIVFTLTVTVTENTNPDATLGFLPENTEILRSPITAINTSTVSSKLRLKLDWEFYNYDETETGESDLTNTTKVTVSDYINDSSHIENILFENTVSSPFSITLAPNFTFVPAESGTLSRVDNGCSWTIAKLSMTTTGQGNQLSEFTAALAGTGTFTITSKMIDEAYTYICYSAGAIGTSSPDYGDPIPAAQSSGDQYPSISSIKTTRNYASFSTRQAIRLNILLQSRQAAFFDETRWFDVYRVGDIHTECPPVQ